MLLNRFSYDIVLNEYVRIQKPMTRFAAEQIFHLFPPTSDIRERFANGKGSGGGDGDG